MAQFDVTHRHGHNGNLSRTTVEADEVRIEVVGTESNQEKVLLFRRTDGEREEVVAVIREWYDYVRHPDPPAEPAAEIEGLICHSPMITRLP